LNESAAACRSALEVKTRAQLPQDWAATQNNLGNALLDLGERTEGVEGIKNLRDAVAAYRAALEVYTHTEFPQDWAATQNNLGNALLAAGERAVGIESLNEIQDAVAAYHAALEVYTRAQSPQRWALAQANLGNALRTLSERAEGNERLKDLSNAEVASRAALEVFTRAEFPQQWAGVQNNLGNVLSDMAERAEGNERLKYLNDATAAYRAALEVYTRDLFPQQWTGTQKNLASTYLLLGDWSGASDIYSGVLQVNPDDVKAYRKASSLYHERLFKFEQAFALHQHWLARHKDDIAAQANFAETHLTTARFSECGQHIAMLLTQPEVSASAKTALRAIEIASLLALQQSKQASAKLDALIADVARQPPTFKVEWSFSGTRYFIAHSQELSAHRVWLEQLLDAIEGKDRDGMLKALKVVSVRLKE
jgi:tetratricopeptide (TPR) repeat protein